MKTRARFHRLLGVLGAHTALRCALFLGLAWIAGVVALGQARGMNSFHDAQFLSAYERHARLSVLGYGEFPLWDPFSCGGLYGLSAPQTRYASPLFLFSLWLGVDRAAALFAVLLPALGMEGMFRYARSWNARLGFALVCAPIFPLSGFFAGGWRWGWVQFLSFCGVPWILLGLRLALRGSRAGAYLCAVSCALTIGFGGTWTLPLGLLLAPFELLDAVLPRRSMHEARRSRAMHAARRSFRDRLWPRARTAAAGVVVTTLLIAGSAAFRLWPMLESTKATLRVMAGEPVTTLPALLRVLLAVAPKSDAEVGTYYVTPVVLLALLALPLGRARLAWCSAGFILLLSLGHVGPLAPFALLRKLPVYDTIRYPERCLVLFALAASLVLATSGSAALAWIRKRKGRAKGERWELALFTLVALGLIPQLVNGWTLMSDVVLEAVPEQQPVHFRQARGNRWLMSHFAAEGMGSLACGEAYPLPMSRHLRGDLAAEEYLVDAGRGTPEAGLGKVQRLAWSPNRIVLQVDARRAARLAVNQNYHPGWQASVGRVESWDGLLSVLVPAGQQRVELRFRPRSGLGGVGVSLLSLVAGALYVWFARTRWQRGALLGLGPACIGALLVLWPEPPWRHPDPVTPTDTPALLDALPASANTARVRFDTPLVLVGTRLPREPLPAGTQQFTLDLFFRREGTLSPALGIFVHIMPPKGKRITADHTEISGQLYLPRIPLDRIAHDSFRVALPDNASPGRYEVRFGLWNAHGDRQRRHVTDAGGAPVKDDIVSLGSFTLEAAAGSP